MATTAAAGQSASYCSRGWAPSRASHVCRSPLRHSGFAGSAGRLRSSTVASKHEVATADATLMLNGATEVAGHASELQQSSADKASFNWTSAWWPILPTESLDPKLPMHVDLLGKSLAIWADSKGAWHCAEDRCPHRMARLSEGRVERGNIQCAFHGWTFEGNTGKCVHIPQLAKDAAAHATACSNPKSCVPVYPTCVAHGLLWIWTESGPQAAATAAATPVYDVPTSGRTPWFVRDFPMRFDSLGENVMDVSHPPYAHHGLQGTRQTAHTASLSRLQYGPPGFDVQVSALPGKYTISYIPPFAFRFSTSRSTPGFMEFFLVPMKPGWTRMLLGITPSRTQSWYVNVMVAIGAMFPWWHHVFIRNPIFDGDTYLLHLAEHDIPLSKGVGQAWIQAGYMPAPVDLGAVVWRQWLQEYGGKVPTCTPADAAPVMSKRDVLDRYSQHTVHCKHCKQALATVNKLSIAAAACGTLGLITAVSAVVAAAIPPAGLLHTGTTLAKLPAFLPAAGLAAACLLAWVGLQRLRQMFFHEGWVLALRK